MLQRRRWAAAVSLPQRWWRKNDAESVSIWFGLPPGASKTVRNVSIMTIVAPFKTMAPRRPSRPVGWPSIRLLMTNWMFIIQ